MSGKVEIAVRPRRRWFINGWEWRVTTDGWINFGNGAKGWRKTRAKAERAADLRASVQVDLNEWRAKRDVPWQGI